MSIQLRDGLANQPVDLVMEDLLVRFVVNVPDEDLSSIERVFFQVEEAQWFYTDFVRQLNPYLPGMKMKSFAPNILSKCPLLWRWGDPSDALSRFGKYKLTIPVRGIALMNKDLTKVVLVQGTESASWSFPRGKISKDESDLECAIREVREETGFDAREHTSEKDVVERTVGGKNFKIFLARNVPEDFPFEPLVRNEIAKIKWFDFKALLKSVKSTPNKFFIVDPILKPMSRWIGKNKGTVSEEELMREAEVKLKALMGIDAQKENVDAGRELLNILQGARPQVENPQSQHPAPAPYLQMNLPEHLMHLNGNFGMPQYFPGFQPGQFSGHPMLPPSQLLPPQFDPRLTYNLPPKQNPVEPAAQTLSMPKNISTLANSKELLSILKRQPAVKTEKEASISTSEAQESNRSKAEELLKVFKKKEPKQNEEVAATPKPEQTNADFSKHELVSRPDSGAGSRPDTPSKKITLLKRDKLALNNDASATLLGLLGKRPSEPTPSKASTELLGLLNRKPEPEAKKENGEQDIVVNSAAVHTNGSYNEVSNGRSASEVTNNSAGAELLGILNSKKPDPSADILSILKPREDKKASTELLGLLNQKNSKQETAPPTGNSDLSAGNEILNILKKSTPPVRQFTPPVIDNFEDFEDFEDFEANDFDDNSASQQSIYNSIANTYDVDSDEEPSYDDHSSIQRESQAKQLTINGSLQDTYGQQSPQVIAPSNVRPAGNGAGLLELLGRRPPQSSAENGNGRNELLSILRGGRSS